MYDQHSNVPAHLGKISLGCLEVNFSDLKYLITYFCYIYRLNLLFV